MQKRNWASAAAVALLLAAGSALFFALDVPQSYARCFEQWRQIRESERVNAELAREIQTRKESLRKLIENPEEQELYLRERQKRVRPGEKIFVLPPERGR